MSLTAAARGKDVTESLLLQKLGTALGELRSLASMSHCSTDLYSRSQVRRLILLKVGSSKMLFYARPAECQEPSWTALSWIKSLPYLRQRSVQMNLSKIACRPTQAELVLNVSPQIPHLETESSKLEPPG